MLRSCPEPMNFQREIAQDTVRSLPLRNVIIVSPSTVLRAAIALMKSQSLGCAVIADPDRIPIGIFSEHSVMDALLQGVSLDATPVSEFSDPDFVTVSHTDPILKVWKAIQRDRARFVCVTNDQGQAMGLTGQRGLAEYTTDCFPRQVAVQRIGSTPWMNEREGA